MTNQRYVHTPPMYLRVWKVVYVSIKMTSLIILM